MVQQLVEDFVFAACYSAWRDGRFDLYLRYADELIRVLREYGGPNWWALGCGE